MSKPLDQLKLEGVLTTLHIEQIQCFCCWSPDLRGIIDISLQILSASNWHLLIVPLNYCCTYHIDWQPGSEQVRLLWSWCMFLPKNVLECLHCASQIHLQAASILHFCTSISYTTQYWLRVDVESIHGSPGSVPVSQLDYFGLTQIRGNTCAQVPEPTGQVPAMIQVPMSILI